MSNGKTYGKTISDVKCNGVVVIPKGTTVEVLLPFPAVYATGVKVAHNGRIGIIDLEEIDIDW